MYVWDNHIAYMTTYHQMQQPSLVHCVYEQRSMACMSVWDDIGWACLLQHSPCTVGWLFWCRYWALIFKMLQTYSCFLSLTAVPFNLPVLRAAISPTFCPGAASLLTVDAWPICWWLPPPWGCSTGFIATPRTCKVNRFQSNPSQIRLEWQQGSSPSENVFFATSDAPCKLRKRSYLGQKKSPCTAEISEQDKYFGHYWLYWNTTWMWCPWNNLLISHWGMPSRCQIVQLPYSGRWLSHRRMI